MQGVFCADQKPRALGLILPEVVFARLLGGIDQWVEFESDFAVEAFDLQHFGMHSFVVVRTYHQPVFGTGFTVLGPVFDVVEFAPGRGPVASRHSTPTVTRHNRSAYRVGELSLIPPNRQYLALPG